MIRRGTAAIAVAMALCSGMAAMAQTAEIFVASGRLGFDGQAPLGSGALVVLEARDAEGNDVAEAVFRPRGAAPFPFEIAAPAGAGLLLTGAYFEGGTARWILPPRPVETAAGDLVMEPFGSLYFSTAYRCGGETFQVGVFGDAAIIEIDDALTVLSPVASASGARYASEDGGVGLWSRGPSARITLNGTELPECSVVPPRVPTPYAARGNEPGWRLEVSGPAMQLQWNYGEAEATAALPPPQVSGAAFVYATDAFEMALTPGLCRDDMTGMPYPDKVEVVVGEQTLRGCGGHPLDVLVGAEWEVVALDGAGVKIETPPTILFASDGALSGSTGCNRYQTAIDIGGEAIGFGPIAATRRACGEAENATERALFAVLASVGRFDIDAEGQLTLFETSRAEPVLIARR